jgi:hypothetical protein
MPGLRLLEIEEEVLELGIIDLTQVYTCDALLL